MPSIQILWRVTVYLSESALNYLDGNQWLQGKKEKRHRTRGGCEKRPTGGNRDTGIIDTFQSREKIRLLHWRSITSNVLIAPKFRKQTVTYVPLL